MRAFTWAERGTVRGWNATLEGGNQPQADTPLACTRPPISYILFPEHFVSSIIVPRYGANHSSFGCDLGEVGGPLEIWAPRCFWDIQCELLHQNTCQSQCVTRAIRSGYARPPAHPASQSASQPVTIGWHRSGTIQVA